MKRITAPIVLILGTTLLLTACSKDPKPAAALPPVATATTTAAAAVPSASPSSTETAAPAGNVQSYTTNISGTDTVTLQVVQSAEVGGHVVDGNGMSLYYFEPDSTHPTKSTCNNACAVTWPPVLATHKVEYVGLNRKNIGSFYREDGSVQMSIGGEPVYTFSKDTAPGQLNGQGVDGNWFAVAPDGSKAGTK